MARLSVIVCVLAMLMASACGQAGVRPCLDQAAAKHNTLRGQLGVKGLAMMTDFANDALAAARSIASKTGCPMPTSQADNQNVAVVRCDPGSSCKEDGLCADATDWWYSQGRTSAYYDNVVRSDASGLGCAIADGLTADGGHCKAIVCFYLTPGTHAGTSTPTVVQPSQQPPQFQYDRLVQVADLHGDMRQTQSVMAMMGLVDAQRNWVGSRTLLVQGGDLVDRGSYSTDLVWQFQTWRDQAPSTGSAVERLLGDHELMWLQNQFSDMSADELQRQGGAEAMRKLLQPNGWLGQIIRSRRIAHISRGVGPAGGPCEMLFIHGAVEPWMMSTVAAQGFNRADEVVNAWNNAVLDHLKDCPADVCGQFPTQLFSVVTLAERLLANNGGVRSRLYGGAKTEQEVCASVEAVTKALGVSRIVTGHNIQPGGQAAVRCGGRLIITDIGMSYAFGMVKEGYGAALQCDGRTGRVSLFYGQGVGATPREQVLPDVAPATSSS